MLKSEQERNADLLDNLDHEIHRLTRKEHLNEKSLVEQVEYMERRIEYEELKNRKVRDQIAGEQAKIDKIRDKYKDRHV